MYKYVLFISLLSHFAKKAKTAVYYHFFFILGCRFHTTMLTLTSVYLIQSTCFILSYIRQNLARFSLTSPLVGNLAKQTLHYSANELFESEHDRYTYEASPSVCNVNAVSS